MDVELHRTGWRRYAVEVHLADGPTLRMDPAPGFDTHFPHDLQHFVAEEQLGIRDGIFGRLERGGTASTFHPVHGSGHTDARTQARERRRRNERNERLHAVGTTDIARSERATYVVWHDWLAHCPEPDLQQRGNEMKIAAVGILAAMDASERSLLIGALPRIRQRADELARRWASVDVGGSLRVRWTPVALSGGRRVRRL